MNPNLLTRHYILKIMNDFMHIKYQNPKLKQSEIASQIGLSTSTLQRCRSDTNMLSPYRIQPKNTNKRTKEAKNTNFDDNSRHEADGKRPQMTSNDLKRPQSTSNKTKNNLKGGSIQENIKINEHYLDEILKNNDRRTHKTRIHTVIIVIILKYVFINGFSNANYFY